MSDVFVSYARPDEPQAKRVAEALRALGHRVWRDDELPAHRPYSEVIEERLSSAKAVVVLWSPESVVSRWVRAEATVADHNNTLLPVTIKPCRRPVIFELTQTADLSRWKGNRKDPAWRALGDALMQPRDRGRRGEPFERAVDGELAAAERAGCCALASDVDTIVGTRRRHPAKPRREFLSALRGERGGAGYARGGDRHCHDVLSQCHSHSSGGVVAA